MLALLLVVLISPHAQARIAIFWEDFNTRTYCDEENTTALWDDVVEEEIRLPQFELTRAGGCGTSGHAVQVAVSGAYAYVADRNSFLQVVDISDPENPYVVTSLDPPTTGWATSVAVAGDYAYVADNDWGLVVIDISDPTTPLFVNKTEDETEGGYGIAVAGDYAYVASHINGLQVVSIENPASPSYVTTCPDFTYAHGVAIGGNYAYVAGWNQGVRVVDISDPTNPTGPWQYYPTGGEVVTDVAVSGDKVYAAFWGSPETHGLLVLDISSPTSNPIEAGRYEDSSGSGFTGDVAVTGDFAYLGAGPAGLVALDITGTTPTLVGTCAMPGGDGALGVVVKGAHAYVTTGEEGLEVVEISSHLANPLVAGGVTLAPDVRGLAVAGNYAYVANTSLGLQVIDIATPVSPVFEVTLPTTGHPEGVVAEGNYAYVADMGAGLRAVDITTPTAPALAGVFDTPGLACDVVTDGNYAYIADGTAGFCIVDIEDPTNMENGWSYDSPDGALGIAVDGDYAYVADYSSLRVFDVSDPETSAPLLGSYETPGAAEDVEIDGDYAYVADGYAGLCVVDVKDPASMQSWTCNTPGYAHDVAVDGDRAYVSDGELGIQVIDISDPRSPTLVGGDMSTWARGVVVEGDYVFVADWGPCGLRVLEVLNREIDVEGNIAQSLAIDTTKNPIWRAKIASTDQQGSILWEMTADGENWEQAGSNWLVFAETGSDLRWRATLDYDAPGAQPECSLLVIHYDDGSHFGRSDLATAAIGRTPTICYEVPLGSGDVRVDIFDVSGRLVRALVRGVEGPGQKAMVWDGTDNSGRAIASGVYFCRVRVSGEESMSKVALVR